MNKHPPLKRIKIDRRKKKDQQTHSEVREETRFTIQGEGELFSVKYVNEVLDYVDAHATHFPVNSDVPISIVNSSIEKHPQQIFSNEQERELSEFVRDASDYYNGLTSKDVRILAFVYGVCNQVELPAGWRDKHEASFAWCSRFAKRYKLSLLIGNSS